MSKPFSLFLILFLLTSLVSPFLSPKGVQAQTENAYDLISVVNGLRASKGLEAYQIDSYLMSYAQQHADYMASIQYSTHTHSDGSVAWESGIQENVAEGTEGIITTSFVVYQIWSDWIHWHIMVDYATGKVGAGVALGDDGMVYYVLNVIAGDEVQPIAPTSISGTGLPTSSGTRTATPDLISLMIKSTPAADGSIIHVVGYGQSLWSIAEAYKIKIDQLRSLNSIPKDYSTIFTGQELLIQPAFTPTSTLSAEEAATLTKIFEPTAIPPTATLKPSRTPLPSASPFPTETPLPIASPENEPDSVAMLVMGLSLLGLAVVVIFGFVKTRSSKKIVDQ